MPVLAQYQKPLRVCYDLYQEMLLVYSNKEKKCHVFYCCVYSSPHTLIAWLNDSADLSSKSLPEVFCQ